MAAVVGSLLAEVAVDKTGLTTGLRAAGTDVTNFENRTTRQFQRLEKQISGSLGKATASAKRDVASLETAMGKASRTVDGFGRSFITAFAAGLSVQAAARFIDSATRIRNALKVAGLEGEELTKVYEGLKESAQRNAVPLEALATLYGRAAQQQKELGVSTSDLIKFTDNVAVALKVAGTDAGTASGALLQLGQALGSGVVHAEEFNSVLEGAPTIAQAAAAGIKEAGGSVAALKNLVVDGKVSSKAFFDGFAAGADTLAERAANAETTISDRFVRLGNVLVDVAGKFDQNSHASEMFGRFLDDLGGTIRDFANTMSSAAPAIGEVERFLNAVNAAAENLGQNIGAITGLDQVAPAISKALSGVDIDPVQQKLGELQKTVEALQDQIKFNTEMGIDTSVVQGQLDQVLAKMAAIRAGTVAVVAPLADQSDKGVTDAINSAVPFNPLTPINGDTAKPKQISLADYPIIGGGGSKGRKGGGSGRNARTAGDRFADDLQSIKDRTEALQQEREAMGLSFEEQQKRSVAFELEKQALHDLREAARQKGDADWQNASLSPDQVKAIDEVSAAYARQADELRKAQDAQDLQRDVLKGVFSDLRGALSDGKVTWQEWGDIALNALDKVIDKIEDQLIDAILSAGSAGSGKSGGGIFGMLFAGIGSLLGFADGGDIRGPGGPTDDKVLIAASDGEHITRAKQANKYRGLLHAINGDTVEGYLRNRAIGSGLAFAGGGAVITGDPQGSAPIPHSSGLAKLMPRFPNFVEPKIDVYKTATSHIAPSFQSMNANPGNGRTRVEVVLSPDLEARILDKSHANSVEVTKAGIGNYDKNLPSRFADITERHG